MKKIVFFLLLSAGAAAFAQNPVVISIGGGISNTSSAMKNSSYMGNGYDVGADVFFPLYRKGWDGTVKGGSLALGISVLADYTGVRNLSPNNAATAGQYRVYGGNTVVTSQSDAKTSGSFSGMIGVQSIISFGKFNLSPSLHAGYLHLKQQGYVQNGSAEINGQDYETALAKSEAQSTSGFVFMPQIKIGYNITPRFAFFVSPSVMMGPEVKHTSQYLVPQGGFNDKKTYELKQLANGTWENSAVTTGRYHLTRLNFGVSLSLGHKVKSPATKTPSRLSMTPTTTRQTQGKTFGEKVASGTQPGADVIKKADNTSNGNPQETQKVKTKSNHANDYISPETEQSPDTLSISTNQNEVARPGNPIGGIIVKGGKNPGGQLFTTTTNGNGEFSFDFSEPGTYSFRISNPVKSDKGINEAGIKKAEAAAGKEKRTYTGGRKNEPQESIASTGIGGMAKPGGAVSSSYAAGIVTGGPLKGIDVKLGKNPTNGIQMKAVTNEQGEAEFDIPEAGSYKIILTTPEKAEAQDFNTTRSNRQNSALATNPGSGNGETTAPQRAEAQDFNTTRSNRQNSALATNPGSGNGETTAPQPAEAQDFNTTRSNRQNSALATNPGSGNGETTAPQPAEAQDFNTTRSNRERGQLAARPGNPIGGIIVKGGKNPGGQLFTTTTNESGEFSFDVSAPGTYSFRISNPVKSDKGINEAGIKKTEVAAGKGKRTYTGGRKNEPQESVAGGPLKGIDVKLGKNPNNGIQMRAVTNEQGEAEFDIPEAGSYKIIIQTPEKMNESKPSKKKKEIKVKEKYDSGLKDTLKTNV